MNIICLHFIASHFMSFEELAISYAIIDTAFTSGERIRSIYSWFEKKIKSEFKAFELDYFLYLSALKKMFC